MDNELIGYIRDAVKQGVSANQALRDLRATGEGIRRGDFLGLYREIRGALESKATGIDRPGYRRPYAREIQLATAVQATGFMQ